MRLDFHSWPAALAGPGLAIAKGALLGTAILAMLWPLRPHIDPLGHRASPSTIAAPHALPKPSPPFADFGAAEPSAEARAVADWVASVGDNNGAPVVIVDKKASRLYVFDAAIRLLATSPVLLGAALGDSSAPGIGERPLALVRPEERTTPAGRFVAERGRNARGEDVVWVDYDAAVSMHRVITSDPAERRLERLASPATGDHRISYGCINVPVAFYETYIRPAFAGGPGIVYVMPDVATIRQVFGV